MDKYYSEILKINTVTRRLNSLYIVNTLYK